ncbi:MAG TPA: metalloregulator ArsR/SmtB family transcription factor [Limnochordia bacterium]|nr:metalloregulator ArsR/SmtB family transcription factor [Limnochordia bacterium]
MSKEHSEDAQVAELTKALGYPLRVRMLRVLGRRGAYCGDLVDLFGVSQSTISHHLKILKDAGLIVGEEQGTSTCYRVDGSRLENLRRELDDLLSEL